MVWTTPSTWVSGAVLTAAQLNQQLRDNLKAIGDPWTSYTVTWGGTTTNPTLGNGTLTGRYLQAGKLVIYSIQLTIGSTTTFGSGTYTFTLPVAARSASPRLPIGDVACYDTSAATARLGDCDTFSTTTVAAFTNDNVRVTNAAPFAWATGDTIAIQGMYEAA